MPSLNAVAQALAGQIGISLAGGMVILIFAGVSSYLLRRGSPAARFAIWFASLVALGSVPFWGIVSGLMTTHRGLGIAGGHAAITLPSDWALALFIAWALIASAALLRIAVGFWQVMDLRRRSATLNPNRLPPEVRETLLRFQSARVAILLSDQIQSPTAIGLLRPAIVLPGWLLEELSDSELRQIFLHELEHLKRRDDWSNLLQKTVKALFFFHPAVWWMEKQISLEREMACDEAVLAQTGNPRAYAQCLVQLAEKSFFRRSILLAHAAVSRAGQTSLRVARILSARGSATTGARKLVVPSFAAALIAVLAMLPRAPQFIAFESGADERQMTAAHIVAARAPDRAPMPRPTLVGLKVATKEAQGISSSRSVRSVGNAANSRSLQIPPLRDPTVSPVVQAKLRIAGSKPRGANLRQLPSAELLVVVVESSWDGYGSPALWQVQMWHVTVLRSNKNPVPQANPQKVI